MSNIKNNIIRFLALLLFGTTLGQQDPQFTQYLYNLSVINPAYTTNELGLVKFGALYRSQWANTVGAPTSMTFFGHASINEKIETGISIISDNIGDGVVRENNVFADFAYIVKLDTKSNLTLGLKGGFTNFDTNFNGFLLPEFQDDTAFNQNLNSIFPNLGAGAIYQREKLYAGVSVPNLLNSTHLENQNGIQKIGSEETHFFLIGGYVFNLTSDIKIKPSFLAKLVNGSPATIDFSVNALFNEKLEGGISYRNQDAVIATFNVKVMPAIRIGYAYDYTLSNLGSFSSGSHEVFALFDLNILGIKSGYDKSPRFY